MSELQRMGQRAMRLATAGQHDKAIPIWEAMHRRMPGHAGISLALGAALLAGHRSGDAEQWLLQSCQQHPGDAALPRLLGRTLAKHGKRGLAIGAFYHSLSLEPDDGGTHAELASALYWDRQSAAALPHAARAFQAAMTDLSLSTYMCVLIDVERGDEALALVDRLLAGEPANRAMLTLYRSNVLLALDRLDEATETARESVRLAPENDVARHHLAAGLLLRGELTAEAWDLYEGRAGLLTAGAWPRAELRWAGQDLRGRTVLLHAEQGLGDTLQFIRYVPLVAALGARVVVAVQPSLVGLLQGVPGADAVVAAGRLPPFDYYSPLLSLPGIFGTTLETIPPALPYAGVILPPARHSGRLQVGVVWAGKHGFVEDRKRSLAPDALAPLAHADVDFHSLQFGSDVLPLPGMTAALQGVSDFMETARRIAGLDLVICVDTSVAHLAATMGKPVWLLARHNGCWRWLQDREDSPWYPSVRLFRQAVAGDWGGVLVRVRSELDRVAAVHAAHTAMAA